MARFDWYQATVRAAPETLRACLSGLADRGAWEPMTKAPHGYGSAARLVDSEGPVCMMWWGGSHEHPHAVISGERAQAGAELLRGELPDHSVSRADACIDYGEPGAYDRLQGLALDVARARRIKVGTAGDHLLTLQGRTMYMGGTTAHTRLRIYDKAAELRQQFAGNPVKLAQLPAELARLECQVRPQNMEAKRLAAKADPVSLMGSAAWMRELMRLVAGLELEPLAMGNVWRQSDHQRSYAWMLSQYGGVFQEMFRDCGSWDLVGRQIGHDLAEKAEAERRRR